MLVSIRHSTNSVGLPTTASSSYLLPALSHPMIEQHGHTWASFSKPSPWQGRAADRSLTQHHSTMSVGSGRHQGAPQATCTRYAHEPAVQDTASPAISGLAHCNPAMLTLCWAAHSSAPGPLVYRAGGGGGGGLSLQPLPRFLGFA